MADNEQESSGLLAFAAAIGGAFNRGVASVYNAVTRDGTMAAAFRQGAGEMGQALKALPDSISVEEPGTVLNPTQEEIADARDVHTSTPEPSPSDIARRYRGNRGTVHDAAAPSPSEIAKAHNPRTVHEQPQGNEQATPSPSEIARSGRADTQEPSWQERETARREKATQDGNAGNDQNERGEGRSLADEQREQDRGRGR